MKLEENKQTLDTIEWYTSNRSLYKQLTQKIHNIISEILEIRNINIHAIFSRTKDISSFSEKILDEKYSNPKKQITDLSGIRIICYVESDIDKVCSVLEDSFKIDKKNSIDKSKLLGTDKVGYKSVHYIAELKDERLNLPEYKKFKNCKFEIQVRTILQHAWAEIEHDRNYKFSGELPEEIQRKFKLLAGTLELVDKEFNDIAREIDKINLTVTKGTNEGDLNISINSTTLKQFLNVKFKNLIPNKIQPNFPTRRSETKILNELKDYGLSNLEELNAIIPDDLIDILKKNMKKKGNFLGLLRNIMISADWERYFEKAYTGDWMIYTIDFRKDIYQHYNIPFELIKSKYSKKGRS